MPYSIKKAPKGGWGIVNKQTHKKVGHSETRQNAHISISYRMKGEKKK